jgi:phage antirepressor YoqD-like protein
MWRKDKFMNDIENRILKKFETTDVTIEIIDGIPMFELYSTGMALGYVKTAKNKQYPRTERIDKTIKNAEITTVVHDGQLFMTENQLYDFMFEAHPDKCKPFRKWVVEEVLPMINKTGGYVETDMEEEFVNNYLPDLSEKVKVLVIKDLHESNKRLKEENEELKEFYDALLSTEGLLPMNIVAKELKVGLKRLYCFLRANDVMFYKENVNVPYQRFMEQELFKVKETPCRDGKYRPATYATRKGLEYIRKMLAKSKNTCAI